MKLSKSESGKLGGLARVNKVGNPGTVEGRRLGGLRSQVTHKKNQTNFILRKEILKPKESESFAEFVGIMLGDGHVG